MKHIVKIEIDKKRYEIPEEVFNFIKQCCDKVNELEEENKATKEVAKDYFKKKMKLKEELNELKKDYSLVIAECKKIKRRK